MTSPTLLEKGERLDPHSVPLIRHTSPLPNWRYLLTFAPSCPSPLRSPLDFLQHPVVMICIGIPCAIISGVRVPALDIVLGHWTNQINAKSYLAAIVVQDQAFFDRVGPGEIVSKASKDIDIVRTGLGERLGYLLWTIAIIVGCFISAFIAAARVAGVLFALIPLAIISFCGLDWWLKRTTQTADILDGRASSLIEQILSSVRISQAFDMSERLLLKLENDMLRPLRRISAKKSGVNAAKISAVFGLGFLSTASAFGTTFEIPPVYSSPIRPAGNPPSSSKASPLPIPHVLPEKLSNVSLRYPSRPDILALDDVSFRMEHGRSYAICGASDAGRSSILAVLERFYDISAGSISVDGQDSREMAPRELRLEMGYVSQKSILYEETVRWNVIAGARDPDSITQAELEWACTQACILEIIQSLPHGFDTDLGLKGGQLSGDQRQRLCIARALIRQPRILLLDEATSALDGTSEAYVQEALDNASRGRQVEADSIKSGVDSLPLRLTITIAHRLSTIRNADTIFVMEQGRIVEIGSHAELDELKGKFFGLVQVQL